MLTELSDAGCVLPVRDLRRRLGEPDRSNLRRGVRGLLRRDLVSEPDGHPRRVALTEWGMLATSSPAPAYPDTLAALRQRWRCIEQAFIEARQEERRRREAKIAANPDWIRYESCAERETIPGPIQNRVLAALYGYADPPDAGLPVEVVKVIVDGERSNVRRAIRTLLHREMLDETPAGDRIRMSEATLRRYSEIVPGLSLRLERFDQGLAETVLEEYDEDVRVRDWSPEVVA